MSIYKCISCGATKENNKICSCPDCGYMMYEMPYNRKDVLISEIKRFIAELKITNIDKKDIRYFRNEISDIGEPEKIIYKEDDDKRFPSYKKIQDYVCSSEKTEEFFDRLYMSFDEIVKHLKTPYSQNYELDFINLKQRIINNEEIMIDAFSKVGKDIKPSDFNNPNITVKYSETPDEELLIIVDDLFDKLKELALKIKKFIKQNNLYGYHHCYKPKNKFKFSNEGDYKADLTLCCLNLDKIINKKYFVDIFSDGEEELKEMLTYLWQTIFVIMKVEILIPKYVYILSDGSELINNDIDIFLERILKERYIEVDRILKNDIFLIEKDEDTLFGYYNQMIELDSFGILVLNRNNLIKIGESEEKLNSLVGLSAVKENIKKIKSYIQYNKDSDNLNLHMCFLGNPGTGKTEVARIIAGILYETKILPTNKLVEVSRGDLVGEYLGQTAPKTMSKIEEAMGGVLFIDEAYSLIPNRNANYDYGNEALATLLKAMEDYRGKFCVIFAGYRNPMNIMLSSNPGLKSRIQFMVDFPNYSREELSKIADIMLSAKGYSIGYNAKNRILDITDINRKDANFSNARDVRNILDQVIMCQNIRCADSGDKEIGVVDVNKYIKDANINLPTQTTEKTSKILTGEEELDQLVGLRNVKRTIKKIKAFAKKNKDNVDLNIHMCFLGNPGTGKTEVARIVSRIFYDAGILKESKLVETDSNGLIGEVMGSTGPKTQDKVNEAMNGVLFIDEAYGLVKSSVMGNIKANYGDEAINVLIKNMEDFRGKFCVIFAGYKKEMQDMISSNPGIASRIQFILDFPDYTREELSEIARLILSKKQYNIENDALSLILDITDYFRKLPDFANARTIRNIIDQVIMNQNLRTEDDDDNFMIIKEDVEDYILDENIDLTDTNSGKNRIGF